ncbi:MAG TPA: rhodanese-like domain-containing protein, partial [Gemmatimonadales bacterium]
IGLDRIAGYLGPETLDVWGAEHGSLGTVGQVTVTEFAGDGRDTFLLDVRGESEWRGGHLPGATLIPLSELPERLGEVPSDRAVVVHCQTGSRSAIAASLLLARGRRASNLAGGYSAWVAAGLPVVT